MDGVMENQVIKIEMHELTAGGIRYGILTMCGIRKRRNGRMTMIIVAIGNLNLFGWIR